MMENNQNLRTRIDEMRQRIRKSWGRQTQPLITDNGARSASVLDTFYEEYMSEEVENFAEEDSQRITSSVCDVA